MAWILPVLALLTVFAAGYWLGRQAENLASVAELTRMAGERDRAVRLAQECHAHMEQVQAAALLAELEATVWTNGRVGVA